MPNNTVTMTFDGINYNVPEFPFEVNRSYEFSRKGGTVQTEPDQNGIVATVYWASRSRVFYQLSKNDRQIISDVFLAYGNPPYTNTIVILGVPYGGTATLSK
jgi:hypothetical protein